MGEFSFVLGIGFFGVLCEEIVVVNGEVKGFKFDDGWFFWGNFFEVDVCILGKLEFFVNVILVGVLIWRVGVGKRLLDLGI